MIEKQSGFTVTEAKFVILVESRTTLLKLKKLLWLA
jgi:hypothetical protein